MKRSSQQNLFDQFPKRGRKQQRPYDHFGGKYFENYNPQVKRPMDSKKALHVVLKSSHAKGARSFKNKIYEQSIWDMISKHAQINGIKIYEYANGGNHLHILLRATHRDQYNRFIRTITGLIARLVGQIRKGFAT
ncbi:MAG: transposase [Bdellovibrionales bacterium]